ncbi:MAG: branched-chain amino acid ABC transporter permease [Candidatus Micrarchaeota archaeon]
MESGIFVYLSSLISRASIYLAGVISANMQYGYTGMLNLGVAAFSMLGAYVTAILVTRFDADFLTTIIASIIVCVIVSIFIGLVSLRTKGDYFALVTLGFGYVLYSLFLNYQDEPINGALGIPSIRRPSFGDFILTRESFFFLCLGFLVILYFIANKILKSHYGTVLRSIRDNEDAARSLGKDADKYKLSIFVIGAVFAGLGGSMYSYWASYIDPGSFGIIDSLYIIFAVLIGGKGNLLGSVAGGFLFILLPEPLRFLNLPPNIIGGARQLILGVLLLLTILYRPDGIFKEKTKKFN